MREALFQLLVEEKTGTEKSLSRISRHWRTVKNEVRKAFPEHPWHPWRGVQQVHQQAWQLPHWRGERYDGGNERTPRESFRQQPDSSIAPCSTGVVTQVLRTKIYVLFPRFMRRWQSIKIP